MKKILLLLIGCGLGCLHACSSDDGGSETMNRETSAEITIAENPVGECVVLDTMSNRIPDGNNFSLGAAIP